MNNKELHSDFDSVSHQEWKKKIVADLKGKDYEETLVWEDSNAIKHQPFYNKESLSTHELTEAIQATQKTTKEWTIIDDNYINDNYLYSYIKNLKHNQPNSLINLSKELLTAKRENKKVLIDGNFYRQAGGNPVQELAFVLQQLVDYLDAGTSDGHKAEDFVSLIEFKLGFGTSYCTEIAKGRAFRYLVQQVYRAYGLNYEPTIIGEACNYYHAHKDVHTNLLRSSTQAMSIVLANCNQLLIPAFDEMEKSSSLGERMAKNIGLILKEESFFEEVQDAAKGSYYLESLSAEIAELAWELFLKIEKEGGLIAYNESGKLQKDLHQSHLETVATYKKGEKKMVGVNAYMNEKAVDLNPTTTSNAGIKTYILSTEIS